MSNRSIPTNQARPEQPNVRLESLPRSPTPPGYMRIQAPEVPNPSPQPEAPEVLSAFQRLLREEGNNPNHPLNWFPPRHRSNEQFRIRHNRTPRVQPNIPERSRTDDLDLDDPIDQQILHRRNQITHPIVGRSIQLEFNDINRELNRISDIQHLIHIRTHIDMSRMDPKGSPGNSNLLVAPPPQRYSGIPGQDLMNGITRMNGEELYNISKYMRTTLDRAA